MAVEWEKEDVELTEKKGAGDPTAKVAYAHVPGERDNWVWHGAVSGDEQGIDRPIMVNPVQTLVKQSTIRIFSITLCVFSLLKFYQEWNDLQVKTLQTTCNHHESLGSTSFAEKYNEYQNSWC